MGKKWQMALNPTKFEVVRIINKRNTIISHYTLHDTEPYRWQCKTFWVTINSKLSWKPCVNSVNKKANNTRRPGFLCRHMQGCPRKIEEQAYIYMYVPSWNMPCPAGSTHPRTSLENRDCPAPSCPLCNTTKLDPRHSVTQSQMLQTLGWQLTLNRGHGQTSSYWIVPCTILYSHQHHHACTQVYNPTSHAHSPAASSLKRIIFQHSFSLSIMNW